ncbi:hypothetical protein ILUMI_20327, partial [Ignelater luminosus]
MTSVFNDRDTIYLNHLPAGISKDKMNKADCRLLSKSLHQALDEAKGTVGRRRQLETILSYLKTNNEKLKVKKGGNLPIKVRWVDGKSAFKGRIRTGVVVNLEHVEPELFFKDAFVLVKRRLRRALNSHFILKVNFVFCAEYEKKEEGNSTVEDTKYFATRNYTIDRGSNLISLEKDVVQNLNQQLIVRLFVLIAIALSLMAENVTFQSQLWVNGTTSVSRKQQDSHVQMHFNQPIHVAIPLFNYSYTFQNALQDRNNGMLITEQGLTTENGKEVLDDRCIQECRDDKVELDFLQFKSISLENNITRLQIDYNFTLAKYEECKVERGELRKQLNYTTEMWDTCR